MRTLDKACFDKKWIEAASKRQKTGNTFFEKCLYAFELLGRLRQEGLDFVFKGGTSLLLRLPKPRRLSIDVDIVCREESARLERALANSATDPFTGVEEDQRRHNRPPRRRHWNFAYRSIDPIHCPEPYIILDVLEEENLYADTEEVEIRTALFTADHRMTVPVPTVDNLLADKLTAFAPATIGQEYSADHPEKIVKHLFDIGELFDAAQDVHAVQGVYLTIAAAEIGYRQGAWKVEECLDDTIQTARLVTALAVSGDALHPENAALLRQGIAQLTGHLLGVRFTAVQAAVAAGKAALLANLIKRGATEQSLPALRFSPSVLPSLSGVVLKDPVLAKIEQVSPEAFYYWNQVERIGL